MNPVLFDMQERDLHAGLSLILNAYASCFSI